METEFGEPDANQEWEIGEPLRRAVGSIPLEPGPSRSRALSEAKTLAQEALATLVFLGQRRQLTAKELRQARAIQRFLDALEEERVAYPGYQAPSANGSKAQAALGLETTTQRQDKSDSFPTIIRGEGSRQLPRCTAPKLAACYAKPCSELERGNREEAAASRQRGGSLE